MNPSQLQHLERTLDRVPVHLLRQAIARRSEVGTDRRRHSLSPDHRRTYQKILQKLSQDEQMDTPTILSNARTSRIVSVRWKLYRLLDAEGFTTLQISTLTGHDRARIHNWKKKTRPILQSLNHSRP